MDLTAYDIRSKYAREINAGYSMRLDRESATANPHALGSEKAQAWQHGWQLADWDEWKRRNAR